MRDCGRCRYAGREKDQLIARQPDVDVLVNNLGIFEPKPFEEIPDEDWLRFFEVNVLSGVRLTRAYLPGMRRRNRGRVVFISSESAFQIPAEMIHYGMTKSAQVAVARGLAETTAGTGVTVNSVFPGPTKSEGVEAFVQKLSGGKPFAEFEREFFTERAAHFPDPAVRDRGRDCGCRCIRVQSAGRGHQRSRGARGGRRAEVGILKKTAVLCYDNVAERPCRSTNTNAAGVANSSSFSF